MDIVEFFQLSVGKWFSHRTSQHLTADQAAVGKSDLQIEMLSSTDPDVVKLCEHHNVNPAQALCVAQIAWSGTVDQKPEKQSGKVILIPIADSGNPNQGTLLRKLANAEASLGRYILGNDDVLTLLTEDEAVSSEERIWFASSNLRLRTNILKQANGCRAVAFCSEIRMGVTKPAE